MIADSPTISQLLQTIGAPQSDFEAVLLVRLRQLEYDHQAVMGDAGPSPQEQLIARRAQQCLWARADELADVIWVYRRCAKASVQ